jgi:hypothetical protein
MTNKNLPPFPKLSPDFTLDDIRKIRDYNHEVYKTMTKEEQRAYIAKTAEPIERIIKEKRAGGVKPVYPKRISV